MLQACIQNVLFVSDVCCKYIIGMLYMLQLLYTYVASIFANVSPISDVYCRSASCCNIAGAGSGRMRRRSPWPQQSPRARQAKRAHNCMRTRISIRGRVCRHKGCIRHAGADMKAQPLHVGQQLQAGQELAFGRG